MKILQLDADGYYEGDFIVGVSGDQYPEHWTADLMDPTKPGFYRARYQGGERDAETGEWSDGEWVETGEGPVVDIQTIHTARVADLNANFKNAVKALRQDYPSEETDTWTIQRDEAVAYNNWVKAGSKEGERPATQFLSALSASRDRLGVGDGFDDLVQRVLANNQLYTLGMSELMARRHAAEYAMYDAVAADNKEALEAIAWSFDLTEFIQAARAAQQ